MVLMKQAGMLCLCVPFENIAGKVSLRVQELKCNLETKTLDNVFVTVHVSVQYQAIREKVYSAFYSLQDLQQQMRSYIFDVVRSSLCQMTLDHAFESKDEISSSLKHHLQDVFAGYGRLQNRRDLWTLTPCLHYRLLYFKCIDH
jgi:regulator of protease activity HflC (stomatin/prohibitin superfamily)